MDLLLILKILILLAVCIIVVLVVKIYKINKETKQLTKLRENDISETNKLFIEKSENELRLFFQFETVLEEMIKILRKTEGQGTKLIKGQDDIKLLLEITLKK